MCKLDLRGVYTASHALEAEPNRAIEDVVLRKISLVEIHLWQRELAVKEAGTEFPQLAYPSNTLSGVVDNGHNRLSLALKMALPARGGHRRGCDNMTFIIRES